VRFSAGASAPRDNNLNDGRIPLARCGQPQNEGALRGFAIVVSQHSTEALLALDVAIVSANVITRFDDHVVQPLVIAPAVIMLQVGTYRSTQRLLAEENHSVEALGF
jgi:hypothetical protein